MQTPFGFRISANAFDEGVEVRNLGEDIVAENKVGLDALFGQFARRLDAKELHQRRDSALFGGPGNVRRRVDAEDGNAPLDKELQQISVIAAELDDPARRPEAEPLGHRFDVSPRVIEPGIRIGREIGVFRKDMLRRDVLLELHEKAVAADIGGERIERLHRIELVLCEIALAKRRHAEIDELGKRAAAEPAVCVVIHREGLPPSIPSAGQWSICMTSNTKISVPSTV